MGGRVDDGKQLWAQRKTHGWVHCRHHCSSRQTDGSRRSHHSRRKGNCRRQDQSHGRRRCSYVEESSCCWTNDVRLFQRARKSELEALLQQLGVWVQKLIPTVFLFCIKGGFEVLTSGFLGFDIYQIQ